MRKFAEIFVGISRRRRTFGAAAIEHEKRRSAINQSTDYYYYLLRRRRFVFQFSRMQEQPVTLRRRTFAPRYIPGIRTPPVGAGGGK